MKYAVVKIGGSQYKVAEGDLVSVEKIQGKKGDKVTLSDVYLLVDEKSFKLGKPLVSGTCVEAQIIDQYQGKKVRVATYKAKSRYRRTLGHRKQLTKLKVVKIKRSAESKKSSSPGKKKPASEKKKPVAKKKS